MVTGIKLTPLTVIYNPNSQQGTRDTLNSQKIQDRVNSPEVTLIDPFFSRFSSKFCPLQILTPKNKQNTSLPKFQASPSDTLETVLHIFVISAM